MADEVKRLKYFKGEFLQQQDFIDEQYYHRRLRYLHNRWLHGSGIAYGLEVERIDKMTVRVMPGMGIVNIIENGEQLGKEGILTTQKDINLTPGGKNAEIYIAIGFGETDGDPADSQGRKMRIIESPNCRALPPGSQKPDNQSDLLLATVTLNNNGDEILNISDSSRKKVGMRGDIEATGVRFAVDGINNSLWPWMQGESGQAGQPSSKLLVTALLSEFSGDVMVTGSVKYDGVVKAYAVINAKGSNTKQQILRQFGLDKTEPFKKNIDSQSNTLSYTLKWSQNIDYPVVQVTWFEEGESLFFEQVNPLTQQSVTFKIKRSDETIIEPSRIMITVS